MKDKLCKDIMTLEEKVEWVNSIQRSPYYSVVCEILRRSPVDDPNFADMMEAFHMCAKVDNIVNKKAKNPVTDEEL